MNKKFLKQQVVDLTVVFAIFALNLISMSNAYAQATPNNTSSVNSSETLLSVLNLKILGTEKELEDRVRKILASQLDSPYSLIVKITIDQELFKQRINVFGVGSNLRTLPASNNDGAARYVRNLSIEDVFSLIKKIRVSLTIDTTISKDQESNLKKTIFSALNLSESRQDTVEIERTDMMSNSFKSKTEAFNREQQSASFQNRKLEIMLKELEIQNRKLSNKDSDRPSSDVLLSEVRKISDELRELKRSGKFSGSDGGTDTAEGPRGKTTKQTGLLADVKRFVEGLELPITLLPLGLLFTFVLLRLAGGQSKTASALKGGLEELGKSVQAMADTLASAAKSASERSGSQGQTAQGNTPEIQKGDHNSGSEGQSIELLQADTEKTWNLMSGTPYFLLSVLKDWLTSPEHREKFLQVTEAIGAENAAWIWSRFPSEEVDQLGPLFSKPFSKSNSFAAVSLLYRAVVREAGTKPDFAAKIGNVDFLISLTDAKLANSLAEANEEEIASILFFLTPQRASKIISILGKKITIDVYKNLESLGNASLEKLQSTIDTFRARNESAQVSKGNLGLLPCIVRVLESNDAFSQEAAKQFLAQNALLAAEVRKRVITFDEVMSLDSETLYELFGSLQPSDAASLFSVVTDNQKNQLEKFFAGKAKLQIQDEMKKIEGKKRVKKQARIQAEKIKMNVLRKVRNLREQGLIDFETQTESEPQAKQPAIAS